MQIRRTRIKLPEGVFETEALFFDKTDDPILRSLYNDWRALSSKLQAMHGRGINLPEVLSESAFCRAMGDDFCRFINPISGANTSFDVFDIKANLRIQVKACSVIPDLTSFGPKSVWDKIFFLDFYKQGSWDGSFDIYEIPNAFIYNLKVNNGQTFKDQQGQGRRPRFSIYNDIIRKYRISPTRTYKI